MRKKVKLCCCFVSLFDSDEDTGEELKIFPKFCDTDIENSREYLQKQSVGRKYDSNTISKIINENNNSVKHSDMDNLQLLKNIEKEHKLYKFWYQEEMKNNKDLKIEINPLSPISSEINISNEKIESLSLTSPQFNISKEEIQSLSPILDKFHISNNEIPSLSPISQVSDEEISQILQVPRNSPHKFLSNSIDKLNNSQNVNISPNFSYFAA